MTDRGRRVMPVAAVVDQPDLRVETLELGVRQAKLHRGEDALAVSPDRAGEPHERRDPRAAGPREPAVEELVGRSHLTQPVDVAQRLLERPGPVEHRAGAPEPFDREPLVGRELTRVLHERPPRVLDPPRVGADSAGLVPGPPPAGCRAHTPIRGLTWHSEHELDSRSASPRRKSQVCHSRRRICGNR